MVLPEQIEAILKADDMEIIIPNSKAELFELALGGKENNTWDVSYDVNGETIREAYVVRCKNGIVANFDDLSMRRRDPNSMVIADDLPTDKPTYEERFGESFDATRR